MALCSLPRTDPGDQLQYKRTNGPYKLIMIAGGDNKLPYGNIPRLLMAWVCTEAVRTRSRNLFLGNSLSNFLRMVGIAEGGGPRARLREQMERLFRCSISLIYSDNKGSSSVSSQVADVTEFWWNDRKPVGVVWQSQHRTRREVFQRDHQPCGTAGHKHPEGSHALLYGTGPLPVAQLPDIRASAACSVNLAPTLPSVRGRSRQSGRQTRGE